MKKKAYCTYKWRLIGGIHSETKAIVCDSYETALEVARDIYSLSGILYVNINRCGRLPKDTTLIPYSEYENGEYINL